jgi:hypothetical protein
VSKRLLVGLLAAPCLLLSAAAPAAGDAALMIPAARIDSGLGDLPPCIGSPEVWLYSQPAARQDSGLGDLPSAAEIKEVWMFMQPAAKVDSGLVPGPGAPRVAAFDTAGS